MVQVVSYLRCLIFPRINGPIKSRNQHIKNLTNSQPTDKQITLLSGGLKFIPTPVTRETLSGASYSKTSVNFPEECGLTTYFTVKIKNLILSTLSQTGTHQFPVALETFLEVKFELANIKFNRPKDNLSQGERKALTELSRDKNIVIKNADEGTTTVLMNRTDKLDEGQVQIDVYITTDP